MLHRNQWVCASYVDYPIIERKYRWEIGEIDINGTENKKAAKLYHVAFQFVIPTSIIRSWLKKSTELVSIPQM